RSTSTKQPPSRPSNTSPDSPTSGQAARNSSAGAPTNTSKYTAKAEQRPMSPRAPAASGNDSTTTGPTPTTSSSPQPTPTSAEATQAIPTPSSGNPTARPTLTWSSYATAKTSKDESSASSSEPSARACWKRRSKTPSKPSKPGTAQRKRQVHHKARGVLTTVSRSPIQERFRRVTLSHQGCVTNFKSYTKCNANAIVGTPYAASPQEVHCLEGSRPEASGEREAGAREETGREEAALRGIMGQINYFKRWVLEPATILVQRFREELDDSPRSNAP